MSTFLGSELLSSNLAPFSFNNLKYSESSICSLSSNVYSVYDVNDEVWFNGRYGGSK